MFNFIKHHIRKSKRESKLSRKLFFFFNIVLLLTIIATVAVFAWNPPTTLPPNPAGQTLYSDSNNNIGIGTLYPGAKLEVFSTSSDSVLKLSRQSATSTIFKLGTDSALVINNNNSDVLTIKNDRVGIGTIIPTAKLHIAGQDPVLYIEQNSWYPGNPGIFFSPAGADNAAYIGLAGAYIYTKSEDNNIFFGPDYNKANAVMKIQVNGVGAPKVGIGTTLPLYPLTVKALNQTTRQLFLEQDNVQDGWVFYADRVAGDLTFSRRGEAGAGIETEHIRIKQNGNVGIGTMNPSATLDINGTIRGATYGFGGIYVLNTPDSSCRRTNPFTGACSCPTGFAASFASDGGDFHSYFCYK